MLNCLIKLSFSLDFCLLFKDQDSMYWEFEIDDIGAVNFISLVLMFYDHERMVNSSSSSS
jgi:hypothetical protein